MRISGIIAKFPVLPSTSASTVRKQKKSTAAPQPTVDASATIISTAATATTSPTSLSQQAQLSSPSIIPSRFFRLLWPCRKNNDNNVSAHENENSKNDKNENDFERNKIREAEFLRQLSFTFVAIGVCAFLTAVLFAPIAFTFAQRIQSKSQQNTKICIVTINEFHTKIQQVKLHLKYKIRRIRDVSNIASKKDQFEYLEEKLAETAALLRAENDDENANLYLENGDEYKANPIHSSNATTKNNAMRPLFDTVANIYEIRADNNSPGKSVFPPAAYSASISAVSIPLMPSGYATTNFKKLEQSSHHDKNSYDHSSIVYGSTSSDAIQRPRVSRPPSYAQSYDLLGTYQSPPQQSKATSSGCCSCGIGKPGLPGPPGPEGRPGYDGQPGKNGMNGPDAEPGRTLRPSDFCFHCPRAESGQQGLPGLKGPPGLRGRAGEHGYSPPPGPPGLRGEPGFKGYPGPPGEKGLIGEPGRMITVEAPMGAEGLPGEQGLPGNPGSPGRPGTSERGPQGPQGDPGRDGRNGQIGPRGYSGEQGPPGNEGACNHCLTPRTAPGY